MPRRHTGLRQKAAGGCLELQPRQKRVAALRGGVPQAVQERQGDSHGGPSICPQLPCKPLCIGKAGGWVGGQQLKVGVLANPALGIGTAALGDGGGDGAGQRKLGEKLRRHS